MLEDKCCSIVPYFKVHAGKMDEFKAVCQRLVAAADREKNVLYYGFCFDGDVAFCREAYADANAVLEHMENIGPLLGDIMAVSTMTSLEVHGPKEELEKLKEPLAESNPRYMVLECGFNRF